MTSGPAPLVSGAWLEAAFHRLNVTHFGGRLPKAKVEWSGRMVRSAGICYPTRRLIRLSRVYFEAYPDDLEPILLHEMIHLEHSGHGPAFRAEARRVGAPRHARALPEREERWRWLGICHHCGAHWSYRTRRALACRPCYDQRGLTIRLHFRSATTRPPIPEAPTTPQRPRRRAAPERLRRRRHASGEAKVSSAP